MGPIKTTTTTKRKTWSEINRQRKEEKRKWKEQNLTKKLEKQKIQQEAQPEKIDGDQNKLEHNVRTISIAVPGSILETAQSPELRTYLSGQIARAACIFNIDEIIVFDDYGDEAVAKKDTMDDGHGPKTTRESCVQLGMILQYLECPQYLRKHFFPIHKHLKYCGVLNPLNAPHHLGREDKFTFREGVVLNKPIKAGKGSVVNVGLVRDARVDRVLSPGLRCTVKLLSNSEGSKKLKGLIVAPHTPKVETGVYWGYSIRLAHSLSKVFSQCPHKDGYDLTIGTSDKGASVDDFQCPQYRHALIVFGGVHGLEMAVENDDVFSVEDVKEIFDHYLNTLPNQGSKTVRTEEAVLVTLASLRPKLVI